MKMTTTKKIQDLVEIYDKLIEFLRAANDERLTDYLKFTSQSLVQLKEMLATGVDLKTSKEILKGVRQGIREMPTLLSSIVPDKSDKLVANFEAVIGKRFLDL